MGNQSLKDRFKLRKNNVVDPEVPENYGFTLTHDGYDINIDKNKYYEFSSKWWYYDFEATGATLSNALEFLENLPDKILNFTYDNGVTGINFYGKINLHNDVFWLFLDPNNPNQTETLGASAELVLNNSGTYIDVEKIEFKKDKIIKIKYVLPKLLGNDFEIITGYEFELVINSTILLDPHEYYDVYTSTIDAEIIAIADNLSKFKNLYENNKYNVAVTNNTGGYYINLVLNIKKKYIIISLKNNPKSQLLDNTMLLFGYRIIFDYIV